MGVWSGMKTAQPFSVVATGALLNYDYQTQTYYWTEMKEGDGAPSARYGASAVWTGDGLLI